MMRFYSGDIVVHIDYDHNTKLDRHGKPTFKGFITGPTNAGRLLTSGPRWRWDFDELYGWQNLKGMAATALTFALHQESGADAPSWMASKEISEEIENGIVCDDTGEVVVHSNYRWRWS